MTDDTGLELVEVKISRAIGFREGAAVGVVVTHPTKTFLIFVGPGEGAALVRELAGHQADRPLTHDVIDYICRGFEIKVTKVVISAIVHGIFCATVVLEQEPLVAGAPRQEVRLDVRASDAMVMALKAKVPLWATRRVVEQVEDATTHIQILEAGEALQEATGATGATGGDDEESTDEGAEDAGDLTGEIGDDLGDAGDDDTDESDDGADDGDDDAEGGEPPRRGPKKR